MRPLIRSVRDIFFPPTSSLTHRRLTARSLTTPLAALTLAAVGGFGLSACRTDSPTQPIPAVAPTNSITIDEFYTPAPTGDADDYYFLNNGEDDVEYSYFLDEEDYEHARTVGDKDVHYVFINKELKHGHGYGDHNHMHEQIKVKHHYHGVYFGHHELDWTDSIALTPNEKVRIDSAMRNFTECAKYSLDSFKVELKPFRDSFRVRRLAILHELDTNAITRDSARALLDSAIIKYETETAMMRESFEADITECETELDAAIRSILTPEQYAIWVRHRGW